MNLQMHWVSLSQYPKFNLPILNITGGANNWTSNFLCEKIWKNEEI